MILLVNGEPLGQERVKVYGWLLKLSSKGKYGNPMLEMENLESNGI